MSDNKKYYYLKLKENFFDKEEIKVIKGMDKGDTYVCIMLEMYLRSLKREGRLMMTDKIPFNLNTLSSVLSRGVDEVKYAIELFKEFDLIEVLDTGAMFMNDIQHFIGHGSSEAERKALYRKKIKEEKLLLGQCPDKRPPEIELEKEIELKLDIDNTQTANEIFIKKWKETPFKQPRTFTAGRKSKLKTRLKNYKIDELFEKLKSQYNLSNQDWFDIDWILKNDENWEKILNEKFKNMGTGGFNTPKQNLRTSEAENEGLTYGI